MKMSSKCYVGFDGSDYWGVFEVDEYSEENRSIAIESLRSEFRGKVEILDVFEDVAEWEE